MSELKVNAITDASGGSAASINGYTPSASNMTGRNRVINGAMMIDQRNAGAAVTVSSTSSYYAVDRTRGQGTASAGVYTVQQSTEAPTGFVNSLKATVTTAAGSLAASNFYWLAQYIEGYNVADLNFGSANAKTVTLSFWVRSSLTGEFSGSLRNSAANRSYVFSYTINSADTWEYKTITILGDTTGTWLTDNNTGISVVWSLGVGSNRTATAGSWQVGNYSGTPTETQLITTLNATFYLTGVQLEVGSSASEFEHRLYGQELALCQRYYFNYPPVSGAHYGIFLSAYQSTRGFTNIFTPVPMRNTPTITNTSSNIRALSLTSIGATTSVSPYRYAGNALSLDVYVSSGLSAGSAYLWQPIDVEFSSEL